MHPEFISCSRSQGQGRFGTALMLDCPCGCGCKIVVPFKNPLDGGAPDPPDAWGDKLTDRWERIGEQFETLTLRPSVHVKNSDDKTHWHGFITDGVVA